MDYDDNDFQSSNLHLAGEGNDKSPVLRPYALPRFDFDDNLHGHLRFDSLGETEVFSAGMRADEIGRIVSSTEIKLGALPVRYLGVPLTAKNLRSCDCQALVEKISARIKCWSAKCLSFAGRLQLLQSVVFSIYNFWSRIVILPTKVIKSIVSLCTAYLWKGNEISTKGAKVSWANICHPKNEGGLGLKDIFLWNKVCILKNLWQVWRLADSLWVDWLRRYSLRGVSVMVFQANQVTSWSWKKILKLRDLLPSIGGFDNSFKTRDVWEKLRDKGEIVPWSKIIWGKLHIPRYSFIAWLGILDRLATKSRMHNWGMVVSMGCVLCDNGREDRDHLFMFCPYSKDIWKNILITCGMINDSRNWDNFVAWIVKNGKGKSLAATILRLSWCAYVYLIWQERNSVLHGGSLRPSTVITKLIKSVVRDRLIAAKFPVSSNRLSIEWGLL